jgi:hypothetical protein
MRRALPPSRVQSAVGDDDPAHPLRAARRVREWGSLAVGLGQPGEGRVTTTTAEEARSPAADAGARRADRHWRLGVGPGLGNARLADHDDRRASRRALCAEVVPRGPHWRRRRGPTRRRAGRAVPGGEGHEDASEAPRHGPTRKHSRCYRNTGIGSAREPRRSASPSRQTPSCSPWPPTDASIWVRPPCRRGTAASSTPRHRHSPARPSSLLGHRADRGRRRRPHGRRPSRPQRRRDHNTAGLRGRAGGGGSAGCGWPVHPTIGDVDSGEGALAGGSSRAASRSNGDAAAG